MAKLGLDQDLVPEPLTSGPDRVDGSAPRLVDTVTELWSRVSRAGGTAVAHARAIGLEDFYSAQGWTERGRWPGAVRIAEDDERDEICLPVRFNR